MRSLASRITIVSVVLVTLAVVLAVGGATLLGQRVADSAVTDSLSASQSVQRYLQQTTAREVALTSDLLAADPHFTAYLVEAIRGGLDSDQAIDRRSVLDQIDARRREMGFDFAMMLDENGQVLVRTDRPQSSDDSRAGHPMVAAVMDDLIPDYGPWREGNVLYNAAVVPVTTAFELVGFLVTGMIIDNSVAAEIKQVTGVDLVFLSFSPTGSNQVASTLSLARSEQLMDLLASPAGQRLAQGQAVERLDIDFDGENWVGRAEPIKDGDGTLLGAVITVDSLDARLAGHRSIQTALIVAGVIAILIALGLSILVARRIARPVSALAEVADQAAQGRYEQTIDTRSKDEVGTLARAISRLLADLREQQEIAGYVSELSRHLETDSVEQESASRDVSSLDAPSSGPAVVLALEWREATDGAETATVEALEQWLPLLTEWARRFGARLAPGGGVRLYLVFVEGEQAGIECCLGALSSALGSPGNRPAMALASGPVIRTGLHLGQTRSQVITGKPIFHCERLLTEAGSGRLLLSPPAFKQLKQRLQSAGARISLARGRVSDKKFYQLSDWPQSDNDSMTLPVSGSTTARSRTGPVVSPGSVLGQRYEILERVGSGAMGTVYKARDRKLDDIVALKMLNPAMVADPDYLDRMKSEIRLARKITHPNVLRTHDLWELDGLPVISMEFVRGIPLNQLIERSGRLKLAAGLRVCSQILQGLAAAHEAGVLHRDIKPANIILDQSGNARLMDFGIARQVSATSTDLTQPGTIVGTANYLSPEVALGKPANQRSDLYSMGVMMYEIFTGQLPFIGDTSMEVCMAHVQDQPREPRAIWPEIPVTLEHIILSCMRKKPEDRYATAKSLLQQLVQIRRQSAAATGEN